MLIEFLEKYLFVRKTWYRDFLISVLMMDILLFQFPSQEMYNKIVFISFLLTVLVSLMIIMSEILNKQDYFNECDVRMYMVYFSVGIVFLLSGMLVEVAIASLILIIVENQSE